MSVTIFPGGSSGAGSSGGAQAGEEVVAANKADATGANSITGTSYVDVNPGVSVTFTTTLPNTMVFVSWRGHVDRQSGTESLNVAVKIDSTDILMFVINPVNASEILDGGFNFPVIIPTPGSHTATLRAKMSGGGSSGRVYDGAVHPSPTFKVNYFV